MLNRRSDLARQRPRDCKAGGGYQQQAQQGPKGNGKGRTGYRGSHFPGALFEQISLFPLHLPKQASKLIHEPFPLSGLYGLRRLLDIPVPAHLDDSLQLE